MNLVDLQIDLLNKAIAHAKATARTPADRRGCALFFLKCERLGATRGRRPDVAAACLSLLQALRQGQLLSLHLEALVRQQKASASGVATPACNTGVSIPKTLQQAQLRLEVERITPEHGKGTAVLPSNSVEDSSLSVSGFFGSVFR